MNILFRCDGSVKIGMGHVVRCLALADHLYGNYNCCIHFAIRQSELGKNKVKVSYPVIESNEESFHYVKWLSGCITQSKSKILIMDMRDGLTRVELKKIKKKTGIKVVTIDDPEDKRLESDLAFYPPAPQLENVNWYGHKGRLFIGEEYIILRKEFLKQYPKPKNHILNILISMGGTDEKNITEFVIDSLSKIKENFKTKIIVGSGYPYFNQLNQRLRKVQFKFELYQNPNNIAEIMSQTDFAIISFGQTAYELAALEIPAIYLCLTEDHSESAKFLVNEGLGVSLGLSLKISKKDIIDAILHHIMIRQEAREVSRRPISFNISDMNKISNLIIGEKYYV